MSGGTARCGIVGVVGRPNVGKSTLTNRLVGEKVAIVSDAPQTTRTPIQGARNMPGGQIVFVDTPGIHKPRHEMNRRMLSSAYEAMIGADLLLFLVEADMAGPFGPGDRFVLERLSHVRAPVLLVINKIDRIRRIDLLPLIDRSRDLFPFREIHPLSALTGENTEGLLETILGYLPPGPPLFPEGHLTDQHERTLFAEIIREKIIRRTRQELPHEACVLIDLMERGPDLVRIEATVLVEKDSQRKIVIGRGGELLKGAGTEARAEIEALLGVQVFLRLWVKTRAGWRDDDAVLRSLGLARAR